MPTLLDTYANREARRLAAENVTRDGFNLQIPLVKLVIGTPSNDGGDVSLTNPLPAAGIKSGNAAAPDATNLGAIPAIATAAAPTYTEGNLVFLSTDLAGALRIAGTFTAQNAGDVADGAADSGNPLKMGAVARTTNRAAVDNGDRVNLSADKLGRLIAVLNNPRELVTTNTVDLTNTTETTLLAAGGVGVFHDMVLLCFANTSNTSVTVTLRDATAGTIRGKFSLASFSQANQSGNPMAIVSMPVPWPQTAANNNWTVQLSGAVNVTVTAMAVKNT
jgi:hypothetical protein